MAGAAAGGFVTATALLAVLLLIVAAAGTTADAAHGEFSLRPGMLAQGGNRCQQDACQGKNSQQDTDRYAKKYTLHFSLK